MMARTPIAARLCEARDGNIGNHGIYALPSLAHRRKYEPTGATQFTMSDSSILVAAGILTDRDMILACQRPHSDAYGGQWEFPGGKVQSGESLEAALRRELEEELGIRAEIGPEVFRQRHQYPDRHVEVAFFAVREFNGALRNKVFESIEWIPRVKLLEYPFLEADRELVRRLARNEVL
ncbi:MAG: (deoxy)nucleoside triphosphate pyrophosphohydrolase [Terriglobia bacterium]